MRWFELGRSCSPVSLPYSNQSGLGAELAPVGLQYWTTSHSRPLVHAHIFPSYHKQGNDRVNEVGKGQVEGAENPGAAGGGTVAFETGLCVRDLGRQCRQRLLEGSRRGVVRLRQLMSATDRQKTNIDDGMQWRAHLPWPEGHHCAGCPLRGETASCAVSEKGGFSPLGP